MSDQSSQGQAISLEFVPLEALGDLVAGTQVLMLMRDPFYGYDEILGVNFDGLNFFHQGRKIEQPCLKYVAGWAALPCKLQREKQSDISVVDDVYRPPRYAGAELVLALRLAQAWFREVQSTLSIGMIPSAVPGELIQALTNLPNTLSPPVLNHDVDQQGSSSCQIPL